MTFTCGNLLAENIQIYHATPLFDELQRDAGYDDPLPGTALTTRIPAVPGPRRCSTPVSWRA
ncbi:hypothetical protein OK349_04820 [Sphingomonas sp. BT-65]|uniref:hypothetical protein n=1 Tax=Sphingomonas sp. BT-65 TaxID=2989821 RepID=UPI0022368DE6|nr:hypothetical protein [Sphingomonas sp. BT-65]MCW4461020.1 hypothetical protein [Sphingomonas sp. BT-65]